MLYYLSKDTDVYLLDEPEQCLNSSKIQNELIPIISEYRRNNKTFVISTHNPILAINTLPFNMILRENVVEKDSFAFKTYEGNIWTNNFTNISDQSEKLPFSETLLTKFEAGNESYYIRKKIYDK